MPSDLTLGIVCTSAGFGGLEMYTLQMAIAFQRNGWKVFMLLNAQSRLYEQAKHHFPVKTLQDFESRKNSASLIKKWNRDGAIPLFFTTFNKDIQALSGYKRWFHKSAKIVYQQHMKVGVRKKDIIHRLRYQMLDKWITPLAYLRAETLRYTTVPDSKICMVPVGIDIEKLARASYSQQAARSALSLPEDALIIGVLGRVDPKKGQDFLIKSIAALRAEGDFHLLIMGNVTEHEGDEWMREIKRLVASLGVAHLVHFRPYQESVQLFYYAIDVFAMPSHGETYGLVTLEAMYFKKPVIGVDTDGTRALLENGKYGWLHPLEDLAAFKTQLFQVINNTAITQQKVQAAYEQVLQQYRFESTVELLDAALKELLFKK